MITGGNPFVWREQNPYQSPVKANGQASEDERNALLRAGMMNMRFGIGVREGVLTSEQIEADTRVPAGKHCHYFKDVSHLQTVDIYRVLDLFEVTDPCLQHAAKKLMVAGGRGAGKSIDKDIQEAIDSLVRWQSMRQEDAKKAAP